jgi:hypothetical protein
MVILAQKAAFGAKLVAAGREPVGITALPKKGSGIDLRWLLLLRGVTR